MPLGGLVTTAERPHVGGGNLEVRAHAPFRHGDQVRLDHRIVHVAAREHVRYRVADEFAHPQLPLGGKVSSVVLMPTGHAEILNQPNQGAVGRKAARTGDFMRHARSAAPKRMEKHALFGLRIRVATAAGAPCHI
jgi:hypothetical protein